MIRIVKVVRIQQNVLFHGHGLEQLIPTRCVLDLNGDKILYCSEKTTQVSDV